MSKQPRAKIHCREIKEADFAAVADLLSRSFTSKDAQMRRLQRLATRQSPPGLPRFGYLLEHGAEAVGAILMISSSRAIGEASITRCNLSSWHVEPDYRGYAQFLISRALQHRQVTYLNVTARPSTWPIIQAQGFQRYSNGTVIAAPLCNRVEPGTQMVPITAEGAGGDLDPDEQHLLVDHTLFGCISVVCRSREGSHPFIFARRDLKGRIPCVQLVYCRSLQEFVRYAGCLGRFLARREIFFVSLDANQPVSGLVGRYFEGKMPKFAKGGNAARLGDLTYTNIAVFSGL